jgi:outer membrane protein assembly factor BamB
LAGLGILAALAATIGAPRTPALVPVADVSSTTMRVVADADNFYVTRGNGILAWNATAYAWRDGTERWRRPLAGPNASLVVAAGKALVVHQPCDALHPPTVDRLDPGTGRVRWQYDGAPLGVLDDAALLVGQPVDGECGDGRRVSAVAVLDPETGRPQWTVQLGQPGRLAADPGRLGADPGRLAAHPTPAWFAIWQPDGRVSTYDATTGRLAGTATLPTVGGAPLGGVRVVADLLVVFTPEPDTTLLSAYRHAGLTLAWQRRLPPSDTIPAARMGYLAPASSCGPMLCVRTTGGATVLDPSTGEPRWRYAALADVASGSGVLVGRDDELRVLDWRTGHVVRRLAGWTVVPAFDDSPPAGTVLVRRLDGASTVLGSVDLRSGDLRVLGSVPQRPARCVLGTNRLACNADTGPTRLWRLPAADG